MPTAVLPWRQIPWAIAPTPITRPKDIKEKDIKDTHKFVSQTEEGDYRYEVRACNALSCGSVQAHTVMVRIAPVSPSNINGIGVSTSGDYSLTWGSGSGTITAYELQQAKDELPAADDLDWQPLQRANTTHYNVAGQTAGRYAYRVRACNDNNCGAWSALKVVEVDRHTVPLVN